MVKFFNNGYTENSYFKFYETSLKDFYDKYTKYSVSSKECELRFYYENSNEINGSAQYDFDNQCDLLSINVGTLGELYKVFIVYMCNPNVLKHIGDSGKEEKIDTRDITYQFNEEERRLYFSCEPCCDTRRKAALQLYMYAVRFIIEHELGHVFDGHTMYINDKDAKFKFTLVGDQKSDNVTALDINTLEMDADAVAISCVADGMIDMYERYEEINFIKGIIDNRNEIFKLFGFSLTTLFLILETEWRKSNNEWNEETGLPPITRLFVNLEAGSRYIKEYLHNNNMDECAEEFIKLIYSGAIEAEREYNNIFNTNYNILSDCNNTYKEVLEYYISLGNKWEEIRLELNRFSRKQLYTKNLERSDNDDRL